MLLVPHHHHNCHCQCHHPSTTLPHVPSCLPSTHAQVSRVENMPGFSTLTPYYGEEVILSVETLCSQTPDGVTTLEYLQTLFPKQWTALIERVKRTMPEVG